MLVLAVLSVVSGNLMTESRWIAKVGISLFHKDFNFTKVWWQGAIAVFILQLIFFGIHTVIYRTMHITLGRVIHVLLFLIAATALYLNYDDFQDDMSHRWLGHHFHAGFYLIWIGWMTTAIYFLFSAKKKVELKDLDDTSPQQ